MALGQHWREIMDSEWLYAGNLWPDVNVDNAATMPPIVVEIVSSSIGAPVGEGGQSQKKPTVTMKAGPSAPDYVHEALKTKKFAMGATCCKQIEHVLGTGIPADWVGKRIALIASTTKDARAGITIPCIRIGRQRPKQAATPPSTTPVTPAGGQP